jgi:hypothetical protein
MANLNDPTIKKAVKDFLDEMSASMSRQQGERDFQKEAVVNIAEKYEIEKPLLKKMAKVFHCSNFSKVKESTEEFEIAYETLFGNGEENVTAS